MNRDRYDLPLTTASDRAAAHYRDGVDCMLSAWHGAEDAFDKAIAEDPGFALAHIGRARLHQLNMEGGKARAMAAQARELAAGATPARKKPCRDHGRRDREQAEISRDRRRGASRRISARRAGAVDPARRVRPLRVLGPSRPRCRQARDLRTPRAALWRGLVVRQLPRLVAHRGGKSLHRPDTVRARHGAAFRKRQRRAWPLACDVRARRHGGGPKISRAMDAFA